MSRMWTSMKTEGLLPGELTGCPWKLGLSVSLLLEQLRMQSASSWVETSSTSVQARNSDRTI